jgi:hypothetical protein
MSSSRSLELVILDEPEYRALYDRSFEKPTYSAEFTEESHRAEFAQLDRAIRSAISSRWTISEFGGMDKDCAIMDNEAAGAWHHCGGIYRNRICCREYVEALLSAIADMPHADLWTYHTSCEMSWKERRPLIGDGEFFVRGGKLFAPRDGNDYAGALLNKRKRWWNLW